MKTFPTKIKTLLILFGVVLGIIMLINLFMPSLLENREGFVEGATASTTTLKNKSCIDATNQCNKKVRDAIDEKVSTSISNKAQDKHFKNGQVTTDFVNYVTDKKKKINITNDVKCKEYAKCQFEAKMIDTTAPASAPVSGPASGPASAPASTNAAIDNAISILQSAKK